MNVLVVGSGAREHALTWGLSRSLSLENVYTMPGNPGTAKCGTNVCGWSGDFPDFQGISKFCGDNDILLVVIGPENPLANGLADCLREKGIHVFGPGKSGARLEASKSFAKDFMARHGIPHPGYAAFDSVGEALKHVGTHHGPWVIKADGLALGKGVRITDSRSKAETAIEEFMSGQAHGQAGKTIVIEEYLEGTELTAMAVTDGNTLLPLPLAQDHKRAYDGNTGPMTGGMGAVSPVESVDEETQALINKTILEPTLEGLKKDGIDYRGVIYAGLMMTSDGPKVLEYNVRFGDPETQCVIPRLQGDICELFMDCAMGKLHEQGGLQVSGDACATVVIASGGYPGSYRKGVPIRGLDRNDVMIFHAGTREEDGVIVTAGGRVLSVSALGSTLEQAVSGAYQGVKSISFEGAYYRKDIGRHM